MSKTIAFIFALIVLASTQTTPPPTQSNTTTNTTTSVPICIPNLPADTLNDPEIHLIALQAQQMLNATFVQVSNNLIYLERNRSSINQTFPDIISVSPLLDVSAVWTIEK